MATLKIVKKWENIFSCELEKVIEGGKVVKLKCKTCSKFENRITSIKGFSPNWIVGTSSVKKDSLQKHVNGDPHKYAADLLKKEKMGSSAFAQQVAQSSAIGRGLVKMATRDKEVLENRFNTAYYLAKKERPYSDFTELLELQEKNPDVKFRGSYRNERAAANFVDTCGEILKDELITDLKNANYYSVLMDGSTDSSVIEQELVYVLFLDKGVPTVKFSSIESVQSADADGLLSSLKDSFERVGVDQFENHIHGLNVDGASVNTGVHNGLGTKISEDYAPWLTVIHCFNHRLELAIKDALKGSFFDEIDTMLLKLYYLYKKSPKRLRELRMFGEIYEKVVPKPAKASGTRWIAHKVNAMQIVLSNYGVFMAHLESLAQTDSQALKCNKLVGYSKKWQQAKYPLHLALYLDILQPLKVISLVMQQETHDPVKQLKHIRDFTWSMTKLSALLEESIDQTTARLTNFTKFLKDVVEEDGTFTYQDVKLLNFNVSNESVKKSFNDIINDLTEKCNERFSNLQSNPVFKGINLLDCKRWPEDNTNLSTFGENEMTELINHFKPLLLKNNCDVDKILTEWDLLKLEVTSMISSWEKIDYLEVWRKIFTSTDKESYQNVLHIIELLLITPTTNAKLERMFSRMNRVKTDWRNRLSRERLENNLRIGEEGVSIKDFDPEKAINRWYNQKVRRTNAAKKHNYPEKRRKLGQSSTSVDVVTYCISDFETDSEDDEL